MEKIAGTHNNLQKVFLSVLIAFLIWYTGSPVRRSARTSKTKVPPGDRIKVRTPPGRGRTSRCGRPQSTDFVQRITEERRHYFEEL